LGASLQSGDRRLPAGPLLFDTGIYIRLSRGQGYAWIAEDAGVFQRTILSSVVAAELYAGTRSRGEKRALDDLCRAHALLKHFAAPPAAEWVNAGILLRRARNVFGQMDFAGHFRDALIALEAVRAGATLVTENVRDFARWKSLIGSAKRNLRLFDAVAAR
jgi:predicted nucleic acid-binding protein